MSSQPIPSPHFDPAGNPRIVDVSAKSPTLRVAIALGEIQMMRPTAERIRSGQSRKGDALMVAQLAAIQSTKLTQHMIPLCHSIPLESVNVEFQWPDAEVEAGTVADAQTAATVRLRCQVRVQATGKTGVEMEALTAVSAACLTVYDMMKSEDRSMAIGPIVLVEKSGGKSGDFRRQE